MLLTKSLFCAQWHSTELDNIAPTKKDLVVERSFIVNGDFDNDGDEDILVLLSTNDKQFYGSYYKSKNGVFSTEGKVNIQSTQITDDLLQDNKDSNDESLPCITEAIWVPSLKRIVLLDTQKLCLWFLVPFNSEVKDSIHLAINNPEFMAIDDFNSDGHSEIVVSENSDLFANVLKPHYQVFHYDKGGSPLPLIGTESLQFEYNFPPSMKRYSSLKLQKGNPRLQIEWEGLAYLVVCDIQKDFSFIVGSGAPSLKIGGSESKTDSINSIHEGQFIFDYYIYYSQGLDTTTSLTFYDALQVNEGGSAECTFQGAPDTSTFKGLYTPKPFNLENIAFVTSESGSSYLYMTKKGETDISKSSITFTVGSKSPAYTTVPDSVIGFIAQKQSEKCTWITSESGKITVFYEQDSSNL